MSALRVLWSLDDWADGICALPTDPILPLRTVVVPNERVAHALRKRLIEKEHASALVGTRFIPLAELASLILHDASDSCEASTPGLDAALVRELLATVPFERFRREDLLISPGWDEAFARTLSELASACVEPDVLLRSSDAQVRDVGRLYERLRAHADWTPTADVFRRAAACAAARREGVVLAAVTGFESAAEAQFLAALPNVVLVHWGVRPVRDGLQQRMRSLFGATGNTTSPPFQGGTRLAALQAQLFGPRQAATAAVEDSVQVAVYAGVHEEVEAAVSWVVEQLINQKSPACELALLAPQMDVYAPLLRARLGTLAWPEGIEPVFSERGIPLAERADGQRLLLAVRALRDGLSRESLAELLPSLRTSEVGVRGLSHAWEVLNALAFVGGERSHPERGLGWADAWKRADERLATRPRTGGGLDDREEEARRGLRVMFSQLHAGAASLVDVLGLAIEGAPLHELCASLVEFAKTHLKLPPAVPPAWTALLALGATFEGHETRGPRGVDALSWLEEALSAQVVKSGRYGEARVYLGTFSGARGLSFQAVRILGLVEGAVPSAVREDPVLPDAARASISPFLLRSRERAHRQLAAFDDAVRCSEARLALSAPRVSAERSSRQPAAVLLDVMAALGTVGSQGLEKSLEDAASLSRERERRLRLELPVSPSARLDRIARGDREVAERATNPALSLASLRIIRDRVAPGPQDGLLAGLAAASWLPGMSAEKPISATRLSTLLSCPHRYLYEHVLGFRDPESALPTDALPVTTFGVWLHSVAEAFWRAHGSAIGGREKELPVHLQQLRLMAESILDELAVSHPFANDATARAQRDEICDQLDKLLLHDWGDGQARTFVDVERGFGYDEPCALPTSSGPLYVRGKIDKLDRDGSSLLVRDIKTGKGKPRRPDAPPELGTDLQLGMYAQVAKQLAAVWGTPRAVDVAYLYLRSGEPERSWSGPDAAVLERATLDWLATAVDTLAAGAFVRTLDRNDCTFCGHQAVCASELDRAHAVYDHPAVPRRLVVLKRGDE